MKTITLSLVNVACLAGYERRIAFENFVRSPTGAIEEHDSQELVAFQQAGPQSASR